MTKILNCVVSDVRWVFRPVSLEVHALSYDKSITTTGEIVAKRKQNYLKCVWSLCFHLHSCIHSVFSFFVCSQLNLCSKRKMALQFVKHLLNSANGIQLGNQDSLWPTTQTMLLKLVCIPFIIIFITQNLACKIFSIFHCLLITS